MPATSEHPTSAALLAYGQGRLSAAEMTAIETHLAACDSCCEALAGTPDDTLLVRAREAATSGFRAREQTVGEKTANPREIPQPLKDHPRYRVLGLLGAGGMGAVYKAEHRLMERMVALKVINPALVSSPAALERFEREVKTAAKLSHPNIVAAHDAEQAGGLHFLVMEFVEGVSLDRLVAARGPLAPQIAATIIRQAALGLQHAHTKGMIHRDIKPQNLMVSPPKWDLKILDFGLARLASQAWQSSADAATDAPDRPDNATRAGSILGTPDYIAPEQAADAYLADIRADIYSLGCTLYFLLAGEPPFPGGTLVEKLHAHKTCTPTPIRLRRPEVPEELEQILDRALAKDPAHRYSTPEEFAKALLPIARSKAMSAAPSAPLVTARPLPAPTVAEPEPRAAELAAPFDLVSLDLSVPALQPAASNSHSGIRSNPKPKPHSHVLLVGGAALTVALLVAILWPLMGTTPEKLPGKKIGTADQASKVESQDQLDNKKQINNQTQSANASQGIAKKQPGSPTPPGTGPTPDNDKPVLIVLPQRWTYFADYDEVRDELRRRSFPFKTVSATGDPVMFAMPVSGIPVTDVVDPDLALSSAVQARAFSAIVFVGFKADELSKHGQKGPIVERLLSDFESQGKPVAAICAGQAILASHGRLTEKTIAVSPAAENNFPDYKNVRAHKNYKGVEVDGLLITAAADADGPKFVEALLAVMRGSR